METNATNNNISQPAAAPMGAPVSTSTTQADAQMALQRRREQRQMQRQGPSEMAPQEEDEIDKAFIAFIILIVAALAGALAWHMSKYKSAIEIGYYSYSGNVAGKTGFYRPTWGNADGSDDVKLPVLEQEEIVNKTLDKLIEIESLQLKRTDYTHEEYTSNKYTTDFSSDRDTWLSSGLVIGETETPLGIYNMIDKDTMMGVGGKTLKDAFTDKKELFKVDWQAAADAEPINASFKWDGTKWYWSAPGLERFIRYVATTPDGGVGTCHYNNNADDARDPENLVITYEYPGHTFGQLLNVLGVSTWHIDDPITGAKALGVDPMFSDFTGSLCDVPQFNNATSLMPFRWLTSVATAGTTGSFDGSFPMFGKKEFPTFTDQSKPPTVNDWSIQKVFEFKNAVREELNPDHFAENSTDTKGKQEYMASYNAWKNKMSSKLYWNGNFYEQSEEGKARQAIDLYITTLHVANNIVDVEKPQDTRLTGSIINDSFHYDNFKYAYMPKA